MHDKEQEVKADFVRNPLSPIGLKSV